MNKRQKLEAIIKKAQEEGDHETIVKIKRALYYAKVKAADKKEEDSKLVEDGLMEDFITTSKKEGSDHHGGRKIRTDITRPNLFYDTGENKNEKEKGLYVKPPVQRSRASLKMVEIECYKCKRKREIHPSEYAQRSQMNDGQFICDACIGNRFRK